MHRILNFGSIQQKALSKYLTNDTNNINAGTLVSAIISLADAAAKKDNAIISRIVRETTISKGLDNKGDLKVDELQLRGILRNEKNEIVTSNPSKMRRTLSPMIMA